MANEPTNLQSAIDMLQKPADVGSIEPFPIFNDKFTPELSRDPVLRKLQQFFRIAKNEVRNPLNYLAGAGAIGKVDKARTVAGIGHNKGPSIFGTGSGTVVSDDVARKIFDVDKEMDDLYDLRKRKKRVDDQYVFNEKLTDKDRELLEIEADALEKAIKNLEVKAMDKIEKRFETNIASRTIDELDPRRIDRPSKEKVASLAVGEKNRDILKNVEGSVDSPGFDTYDKSTYGGRKFSTQLHRIFKGSDKDIEDPDYLYNYTEMMTEGPMTKVNKEGIASLNPLEIYEKSISPPVTMQIGVDYGRPIAGQTLFFVDPKKLANKLDKSDAGKDFFKLRKDEVDYLDKLEKSIMTKGYQPNPVQISIYPSGNATIFEGNHRLYRALTRGDKEVPVTFQYLGGAERLDTPFGINELDTFVATGKKGYKKGKELAKYIKDVEKTYRTKKAKGDEVSYLQSALDMLTESTPVTKAPPSTFDLGTIEPFNPIMDRYKPNPLDEFAMMMADPTKKLKVISTPIKMQLKPLFAKRNKFKQLIDKQKFNYERGQDLASKADPRDIEQGNYMMNAAIKSGKRFQQQLNDIEEKIRKIYQSK